VACKQISVSAPFLLRTVFEEDNLKRDAGALAKVAAAFSGPVQLEPPPPAPAESAGAAEPAVRGDGAGEDASAAETPLTHARARARLRAAPKLSVGESELDALVRKDTLPFEALSPEIGQLLASVEIWSTIEEVAAMLVVWAAELDRAANAPVAAEGGGAAVAAVDANAMLSDRSRLRDRSRLHRRTPALPALGALLVALLGNVQCSREVDARGRACARACASASRIPSGSYRRRCRSPACCTWSRCTCAGFRT
jgi:hypothetical protein